MLPIPYTQSNVNTHNLYCMAGLDTNQNSQKCNDIHHTLKHISNIRHYDISFLKGNRIKSIMNKDIPYMFCFFRAITIPTSIIHSIASVACGL